VRRGDQFLVLHTVPGGQWNHAAGQVEPGERPLEAARRELVEETGLTTPVTDLMIPQHYRVPDAGRDDYPVGLENIRIDSFVADAPELWEPTLSDEHDDLRWCSYAEALELLTWPEARNALVAAVSSDE
jgi:8-oxo-dGTP pyrophosphatase MutT (NUDIX family)